MLDLTPQKRFRIVTSVQNSDYLANIDWDIFDLVFLGNPFCRLSPHNPTKDYRYINEVLDVVGLYRHKIIFSLPIAPVDSELPEIDRLLRTIAEEKVRGVEVHSHAMAEKVGREYPDLELYFGSFANVYTDECARLMKELGCKGGTLPFELSLEEITAIKKSVEMDYFMPVLGFFPIAFSQSCFFHPEAKEFPFECSLKCQEGVIVDFGKGLEVVHRGRVIFSRRFLNMLSYLSEVIPHGWTDFRIEGMTMKVDEVNLAGNLLDEFLSKINDGKMPDLNWFGMAVDKLTTLGFCNGFFFGQMGIEFFKKSEM
jgi:collagenase-like PrtC family protease